MWMLQSNEVYGLVSKDLTEVSAQATSSLGSAASTVKKTLVVSFRLSNIFWGIFWDDALSNISQILSLARPARWHSLSVKN